MNNGRTAGTPRSLVVALWAAASLTGACGGGTVAPTGDDDDVDSGTDPCAHGESPFDPTYVHAIGLEFGGADWAEIIEIGTEACEYCDDPRPYFPAAMTIDGVDLNGDVGVRLKGHSSLMFADWENHIFPFKVDFNEFTDGQDFASVPMTTDVDAIEAYAAVLGVPRCRCLDLGGAWTEC